MFSCRVVVTRFRHTVTLSFTRSNSKNSGPKCKWFFCSDAPLTKPSWFEYKQEKEGTKFLPFLEHDERELERAFQQNADRVEVREDRLFEVDLKKMVLSPVYWEGPTFEVRRGTWFDQNGVPLKHSVVQKIEEAYARRPFEHRKEVNGSDLPKQPKDIIARFNKEISDMKRNIQTDKIDFSKEQDAADLGDNKAVVFFDDRQAALFPSDISPMQLAMLRKLGSNCGTLLGVTAIQKGYTEDLNSSIMDSIKSAPVPSLPDIFSLELSTMFSSKQSDKAASKAKEVAEKDSMLETVIASDFQKSSETNDAVREIDHLMLCVHGIGQILGYKYESVNFTHSINVLRSTMGHVFKNDESYRKLAYGDSFDPKNERQTLNNRIQSLPVTWRHKIMFHPRKRHDESGKSENCRLPSLSDLNADGVKPLRNIVGDVILDVLLYYDPKFMTQILEVVASELNRVYHLYKERNPNFTGKIHILGHSLGSAIVFDLLSMQQKGDHKYKLDFDVDNLFCIGSPVGAFKLLQRKNIVPRSQVSDDFDAADVDSTVSSPKCRSLYNIFHPSDPVAYRMEPLVKPSFAKMRPEEVPFALKGFNTQVKNLTSMGDEVQQKIFSNWFGNKKNGKDQKVSEKKNGRENALGDIITTLASPLSGNGDAEQSVEVSDTFLTEKDIETLTELNRSGRIDYCLPTGVFSIALISAISAHVSYFEDEDTAGFVMKQILSTSKSPVEAKEVEIYK